MPLPIPSNTGSSTTTPAAKHSIAILVDDDHHRYQVTAVGGNKRLKLANLRKVPIKPAISLIPTPIDFAFLNHSQLASHSLYNHSLSLTGSYGDARLPERRGGDAVISVSTARHKQGQSVVCQYLSRCFFYVQLVFGVDTVRWLQYSPVWITGGWQRPWSPGPPLAVDPWGGDQLRHQDRPHPGSADHGAGRPASCHDGDPGVDRGGRGTKPFSSNHRRWCGSGSVDEGDNHTLTT